MTDWCAAWPDELKEAERRRYRAECKLRCLTASLDRVDPDGFDDLMQQIEATREELYTAGYKKIDLMYKWSAGQYDCS